MNIDQIRNYLILDGWIPLRHKRESGFVWVGIYKTGLGLVYYDIDIGSTRRVKVARQWPYEPMDVERCEFISRFKCRWSDVEAHLPEIFEQVMK